MLCLTEHHCLL